MQKNFLLLLLAAAVAGSSPTFAQQTKVKVKSKVAKAAPAVAPAATPPTDWSVTYAQTITPDDLRKHLAVLASDAYEGRETGEKGQKMAADYISTRFKELGLTGPVQNSDNPYLQHFTLERSAWDGSPSLQIGKQPVVWKRDFWTSTLSPAFRQETTVQPVFAGYGIEQEGYSDYAALGDVKGKDLVVLVGEPMKNGKSGLPSSKFVPSLQSKITVATQKGARSILFVYTDTAAFRKNLGYAAPVVDQARMSMVGEQAPARAVSLFVSPAMGLALLRTTPDKLQAYQDAAASGQPPKATFRPAEFKTRIARRQSTFATENVMGYLEGSDKKDELLVVTAHYDHLGQQNGVVYNGADDDGSGTTALLELAEAFTKAKAEGHGPRRSILFLAVTGEEKGLFGSQYYTNAPVFPLAQTVADLNMDMIGRTDDQHKPGDQYVEIIGSDKLSSELHAINEAANQRYTQLQLGYVYNDPNHPERFYYRSDHYNFAKNNIPVIFYTTGDHPDYHQPTDDVDKIEFPLLAKRAKLVFHTAWELVNRDKRIVIDSNKQ